MVAYSFKAQFAEPIIAGEKRQTVRGERKRHARPGERLQLFTAMRTKHCRKLLDLDPVCIDVRPISIVLDNAHREILSLILLDGVVLNDQEVEAFAIADGFRATRIDGTARAQMGEFWLRNHELNQFTGVVIRWQPQLGEQA